ncbi:hypothetical protein AFLA_010608 [Aspergillus flavus NRRL3357]|nr:hypothetical protein AFLA_010608 [Aspergillus flavus NRRL3357]
MVCTSVNRSAIVPPFRKLPALSFNSCGTYIHTVVPEARHQTPTGAEIRIGDESSMSPLPISHPLSTYM